MPALNIFVGNVDWLDVPPVLTAGAGSPVQSCNSASNGLRRALAWILERSLLRVGPRFAYLFPLVHAASLRWGATERIQYNPSWKIRVSPPKISRNIAPLVPGAFLDFQAVVIGTGKPSNFKKARTGVCEPVAESLSSADGSQTSATSARQVFKAVQTHEELAP